MAAPSTWARSGPPSKVSATRCQTPTMPDTNTATDTLTFDVEGMTCASCVSRIERVLGRQEGVEAASVNLASRSATVRVGDAVNSQALAEAVNAIGYEMALRRPDEERPS